MSREPTGPSRPPAQSANAVDRLQGRGARPEQAALTRDNDLAKHRRQRSSVIESMVDALNDHDHRRHRGAFCVRLPLDGQCRMRHEARRARFPGQLATPVPGRFQRQGLHRRSAACRGRVDGSLRSPAEATHSGEFMGIAPTGRRVEIRYMDFWHVRGGRIADNWVMVDFAHVMRQLGVDPFAGQGWEAFDEGRRVPPRPTPAPPPAQD
jgi:hypothetical protein